MKFLFSQRKFFVPEQSGREIFEIETKETQEILPGAKPQEFETSTTKLDTNVDKTVLSTSVETEKELKLAEAVKEGDKLYEDIKSEMIPESEARKLTPRQYHRKIENIGKRFQGRIDHWQANYAKVIPEGYMDNLKIGAVAGTFAFISKGGTIMQRLKSATVWTAGIAAITHPAVLGGIAGTLKTVGTEFVGPMFVGIPNLVVSLIDNPKEIFDAMVQTKNGKNQSMGDTPIYKLLTTGHTSSQDFSKKLSTGNQNAFELATQGLIIGDANVRAVTKEMDLYENAKKNGRQPAVFSEKGVNSAATFILQMAEHKLNDREMAEFRLKLWNEEATPAEIRRVLATNAERDMFQFFQKDPSLRQRLKKAMNSTDRKTIKKVDLSKVFKDGTVAKGQKEFGYNKPKRGIRRFLSMGAGGMAMAVYILSFLAITGAMKMKGVFQKETYTTAKAKTVGFTGAFLTKLGDLVKGKPDEIDIENGKKILKKYGDKKKPKLSSKIREGIWKKMSTDDKKALISQTKTFVEKEKKEKDWKFKYDEFPAIIETKIAELKAEAK